VNYLIVDESFWKKFSESFGNSEVGESFWYVLLLCLGAILTLLVGRRIFRQFFVDREGRHLFNELCAAHRLGKRERRFLRDYAYAADLRNICLLFIRPELFDKDLGELFKKRGLFINLGLRPGAFKTMRDRLKKRLFSENDANGTVRRQADDTDKTA
jgi:hypothetical protein